MILALTHVPSPRMDECEVTFVARSRIDYDRTVRQHAEYCQMLRECGAEVLTLTVNRDLPDCAFVEDTAIVLDETAVMASMGAKSRRAEPAGIESELRRHRDVQRIVLPATLDGGDVLRIGRVLLVGISSRTNAAGAAALRDLVERFGYEVRPIPIRGCLHLKSAGTALPDGRLLINPAWLELDALRGFEFVRVPAEEPLAADVALVNSWVCVAAEHKRTAEILRNLGFAVRTVDLSEFAKAEGGVTCLSILFRANP